MNLLKSLFFILSILSVPGISSANTQKTTLNGGQVVFQVNSDVEVSRLSLQIRCKRKATIWEMGGNGGESLQDCDFVKINGVEARISERFIDLKRIGKNVFSMDRFDIEYPTRRNGAPSYFLWLYSDNGSFESGVIGFLTADKLNAALTKPIEVKAKQR